MKNEFTTSCNDEYWKEKEKREKKYRDACIISGEFCDRYLKDGSCHDEFFEALKNLDIFYLEWQEGVKYIHPDEEN